MRSIQRFGLALTALAATSLGFSTVALAQAKTWPKVKIATEGAYAPYNFTGPGGKLEGFEIDLAAELCKRMKATCEIVAQDWDGIIPALTAGKYDAIMAGMNITEKREQVLAFSRPYSGEPSSFGVEKTGALGKLTGDDKPIDLASQPEAIQKAVDTLKPLLKGKTIGVQVSTIQADFLTKYFKDTAEIREYKTTEQHDLDLLAGRVDAIFAGETALRATFEKPDFKSYGIAGPHFKIARGVAVGLRKTDPELKALFDDAIASMLADGSLKPLSLKWFKADITPASGS